MGWVLIVDEVPGIEMSVFSLPMIVLAWASSLGFVSVRRAVDLVSISGVLGRWKVGHRTNVKLYKQVFPKGEQILI